MENDALAAALEQAFAAFGTLGSASQGGFDTPASADALLDFTVGDYLALLTTAEQVIALFDASAFSAILNNPDVAPFLDAETRSIFEAFAAGDYSLITDPLNEARQALAQYSSDTLLRDIINDITPGGTEDIVQAFSAASTELTDELWVLGDGVFVSPLFTIDPDTGTWFAQNGDGGQAYSGTTLAEFYSQLGDAVGDSILSYLGSLSSGATDVASGGGSAGSLALAQAAAQAAASQAYQALQGLLGDLSPGTVANLTSVEGTATAQFQALLDTLTSNFPTLAQTFTNFMLGSRNSDPTFVVSFEGAVPGSDRDDWFYLSELGDTFGGGAGVDILFGLGGDDNLAGDGDDDALFGGVGNDNMTGGAGDDGINGGAGDGDIASYLNGLGQFTVQLFSDNSVVVQDRAGGEGTDTLVAVEQLNFGSGASIFTDGVINLTQFQAIANLDSAQIDSFVELYIAYFNRAPDAIGLNFWGNFFASELAKGERSSDDILSEIASLFLDQDETRATYPEGTPVQSFIEEIYRNVLGREGDEDGVAFWTGVVESGAVARGEAILRILEGVDADPGADATADIIAIRQGDRSYLDQKTDIGTYYAVIRGLSDVTDASEAMQLFVRGDESTVQTAVARVDQEYNEAIAADSGVFLMPLVGVADNPFEA